MSRRFKNMSTISTTNDDQESKEKPYLVRKRRRLKGEKVCQICGDKALAHHFGVLACETCKAFFRRNALRPLATRKCLFQNNCTIDKKTRRFCPACRLKKCFDLGMQTDLILDEDERQQRQRKVKENRVQRQEQHEGDTDRSNTSWSGASMSCNMSGQSPDDLHLRGLARLDDHMSVMSSPQSTGHSSSSGYTTQGLQCADHHPPCHQADMTFEVSHWGMESNPDTDFSLQSQSPSDAVSFTSIHSPVSVPANARASDSLSALTVPVQTTYLSVSGCQPSISPLEVSASDCTIPSCMPLPPGEFHHIPRDQLPSDPYMYWRLSEDERCLLTKLSTAYQDTVLSILHSNPPKDYIIPETISKDRYLQECEAQTRNAIKFVKQMEDFQQLNIDNQIALLKASTGQVLGLRNSALYIAEKDAWLTSFGYMTSENAARIFPDSPHFQKGKHFCKAMKAIVKNDITMYALLHCLILFDPSDDRVLDRQLVNSIRDKYVILLRHYLESLYSYRYSDKYLMALQANLSFYRELAQDKRHLVKKLFPGISNQLLLEVYDLN